MLYRPKAEYIEAWQWNGQPREEWPAWLGVCAEMLGKGLEQGWYFIDQGEDFDRAKAVPQITFERVYEPVSS